MVLATNSGNTGFHQLHICFCLIFIFTSRVGGFKLHKFDSFFFYMVPSCFQFLFLFSLSDHLRIYAIFLYIIMRCCCPFVLKDLSPSYLENDCHISRVYETSAYEGGGLAVQQFSRCSHTIHIFITTLLTSTTEGDGVVY